MKDELIRNASATVTTTSSVAAEQCFQQRTLIVITNTSTAAQVINLSIDQEAVAGVGIQLSPGGVFQDSRDGGYFPTNKQINVISSAAGGSIAIQERVLMDTY